MGVQKNYLDGIVAGAAKRDGLGNLIDKHYINKKDAVGVKTILEEESLGEIFNDYENNIAAGKYSHVEGSNNYCSGDCCHVEGVGNIGFGSKDKPQHVQGIFNERDEEGKYAHIVGNGTYSQRRNIHTLDWEGNAWYNGIVDTKGIVLTSPNGTKFKITVDDEGNLQTSQITTQALNEGE